MSWNQVWNALTLRRRLWFAAVVIVMMLCWQGFAFAWFFGLPVACLCTFGCKTSGGFKTLICWMWMVYCLGIGFTIQQGYREMHSRHSHQVDSQMMLHPKEIQRVRIR